MKLILLGTGVVAATGLSMALFGTGVAAADDYAGQTYADASSAAGDAGLTPLIVTRSGGCSPTTSASSSGRRRPAFSIRLGPTPAERSCST